uniref:HSF-type DNA-binding domain-containing protein n=1 Tax=Helicotheca tamesis TaxID=374047 RepID=A0A7S2I9X4_9STRA|eukprot:CAMPEP_0185730782 /NCGR_PEP_ID=MMETSP1171-20130828/11012_1 /TAXON_ID=374046 /ORGANISM="Helicotheca tamensis, Strain CCMP826" /LENGTH=548 /DNA_ID=CAMNT_0028399911 /DNA_START=14 /DNA_END=1660 /DNA_ORIENTATION=+
MVVVHPQHTSFPPTAISPAPTLNTVSTNNVPSTKKKTATRHLVSAGGSKKKDAHDCPIFLKKTYHMIDGCDPAIASWAEDGQSFVIKDTAKFGSVVIPQFFKHNKISSFVRQLNFYGFRKVKVENIKINPALEETEGKYWRFRHENFLRGRPDLLGDIRKANQMISPEQAEVDTLKKEVKNLKDRISNMTEDIQKLTALVETVTKNQQQLQHQQTQMAGERRVTFADDESPTKKRKVEQVPTAPLPAHVPSSIPACPDTFSAIPQLPDLDCATDSDLLLENTSTSYAASIAPPTAPLHGCRATSFGSVSSMDQDFVALFSDDLHETTDEMAVLERVVPDIAASSCAVDPAPVSAQLPTIVSSTDIADPVVSASLVTTAPTTVVSSPSSPAPDATIVRDEMSNSKLVHKLRDALDCLPKKMQEVFVERLVATIATPEQFKESIQAVSALAAAAAEDAQRRLVMSERIPPASPVKREGSEKSPVSFVESSEPGSNGEAERIAALPLAAAALAAFLSEYAGTSAQDRQAQQLESSSSSTARSVPSVVPPES